MNYADDDLINPELLKEAAHRAAVNRNVLAFGRQTNPFHKAGFVPGGDPSMGGGAPPPGGDPTGGMGGMPPMPGMDPAAGGDPSASMGMGGGGAAPPPPPPSGGGGGDMAAVMAKLDQLISAGGGGSPQSGGNAAGQIKPKIDVNVAIMQMSKMIARIADAVGVKIPASEMIATPDDLTQMANKQQAGGQQDAAMGGGAGGGIGGIPPMPDMSAGPMGKAGRDSFSRGVAFTPPTLDDVGNRATAIQQIRVKRAAARTGAA